MPSAAPVPTPRDEEASAPGSSTSTLEPTVEPAESTRLLPSDASPRATEAKSTLRYEGGMRRALARWICGLLVILFFSLETMGYQALLPALYREGLFEFECSQADIDAAANETRSDTVATCDAQQQKLDLLFTLAYVGLNLANIPLAWLMYRVRPRQIVATALVLKAVGYVLLALSTDGLTSWGYDPRWQYLSLFAFPTVAALGLAATNPFFNLSQFLFATAYVGMANTSMAGMVDGSAVWYYVARDLYTDAGVSLWTVFMVYAGMALCGAFVSYHMLYELESIGGTSRAMHAESEAGSTVSAEWVPLWRRIDLKSFAMCSQWHCAFFITKYFYMTNITAEAEWLTDGDHARALDINTAFSIILPCMGLLTPFVGWVQMKGMQSSIVANTVFALLACVSSCVRWYPLQYVMIVSVATSRFLVFSILPTIVMHPQMFGIEGPVVFAILTGIAGAASTVNYGLTELCHRAGSYLVVNIVLGVWCLVASTLLIRYLKARGLQ